VSDPVALDKPTRTLGWPKSPTLLFGIAAVFFVASGTVLTKTGLLSVPMPILRDGQIGRIPAGILWVLIGVPFGIFALIYGAVEFGAGREFNESSTRIHFVCTIFTVIEAIREYVGWAESTGKASPDAITTATFAGVIAFSMLTVVTFAWNLATSRRKLALPH
jgi:hypothetical protein